MEVFECQGHWCGITLGALSFLFIRPRPYSTCQNWLCPFKLGVELQYCSMGRLVDWAKRRMQWLSPHVPEAEGVRCGSDVVLQPTENLVAAAEPLRDHCGQAKTASTTPCCCPSFMNLGHRDMSQGLSPACMMQTFLPSIVLWLREAVALLHGHLSLFWKPSDLAGTGSATLLSKCHASTC